MLENYGESIKNIGSIASHSRLPLRYMGCIGHNFYFVITLYLYPYKLGQYEICWCYPY